MVQAEFAQLVTELLGAIGQSMASVREVSEGMLVKTADRFLFAFIEDPNQVSLEFIQRVEAEVGDEGARLVVLAPTRLPLALTQEVLRHSGSVVDGARFHELVRGLGLGALIGDAPPAPPKPGHERLLPSARQLDEVMVRAKSWMDWGIPALALRFFRQASQMKPEFMPARNGIGQSLLALGLHGEAEAAFAEVLAVDATNLDARIGKAAVLGATGRTDEEIAAYRSLLREAPDRPALQAHLIAALIDTQAWSEARREVEGMLEQSPDDPRLRFLHAATLARTGEPTAAERERGRARSLGLPYEGERVLAARLGLPAPPTPTEFPVASQRIPTRRRVAAPPAGTPPPAPEPPPTSPLQRPVAEATVRRRRRRGRARTPPTARTARHVPRPSAGARKAKERSPG